MTTVYQSLLGHLTEFNSERDRYWDNLQKVVSGLPNLFRQFLGLDQPGWESPDGSMHSYIALGKGSGNEFVESRSFELDGTDDCELPFVLRVTLNPVSPLQSEEILYLQIKVVESVGGYILSAQGISSPVSITKAQAEAKNFDPLWNALTEKIRRQFDPKVFTTH